MEESMRLEGQMEIAARRERVFEALTDPDQVAGCVPGRPAVEVVDARHFRARVPISTGFFRTTAVVDIALTEVTAPSHVGCTASGSAMGGGASGAAAFDIDEVTASSSRVRWAIEVGLSGMLSGFASMVEGPARSGIGDTLACLKSRLEAPDAEPTAT